ncbi:MAG TPA: N-acetyltransferase [Saprospiraceae bacterium]|nr:N-acetyltransferase [Saprospiraceae bacterium]HHH53313.1 N-acetyltransferase [Bacteroidota bacterium]
MENVFIKGEKVFLRAFEHGDENVIAKLENNPELRSTLFYAIPTNKQQLLEKTLKHIDDPNSIIFTICDIITGNAIGQTAFYRIDWIGRMATFYIGIADPGIHGKGYGKETVELMLKYAFDILNLHRVQLHVATKNIAGIKAYKKNGFIIEGTLREAMYGEGKYHDFYLMAILRKDYKKL